MNYRSVADLNDDIVAWSHQLSGKVDVIVGIPRSGLLVANLLSLHLNLPMTDVDGFLENRLIATGQRLAVPVSFLAGPDRRRVLVVDDSVWSGTQMAQVRKRIAAAGRRHAVSFGAVYVVPTAAGLVDFFFRKLAVPRAFEWNILHHPALAHGCAAIEGVLWPAEVTSLGATADEAERTLAAVSPTFLPTRPIGRLIATQPEAARRPIEDWLRRHAIPHETLCLVPPADPRLGRDDGDVAADKARLYRRGAAWICIEGSRRRAILLARAAGRPVYSFDVRRILFPDRHGEERYTPRLPDRLRTSLRGLVARVRGGIQALCRPQGTNGGAVSTQEDATTPATPTATSRSP